MQVIVECDPAYLAAELPRGWPGWCPRDILGIVLPYVDPRLAWGLEFRCEPSVGETYIVCGGHVDGVVSWVPGLATLHRCNGTVTSVAIPVEFCTRIRQLPSGHVLFEDTVEDSYVLDAAFAIPDLPCCLRACGPPDWWPQPRRVINHYGKVLKVNVFHRSQWHVYYRSSSGEIIVMHSRRDIHRRGGLRNPRIVYANERHVYLISSGVLQICCARTLVTITQYVCSDVVIGSGCLYVEKSAVGAASIMYPQ